MAKYLYRPIKQGDWHTDAEHTVTPSRQSTGIELVAHHDLPDVQNICAESSASEPSPQVSLMDVSIEPALAAQVSRDIESERDPLAVSQAEDSFHEVRATIKVLGLGGGGSNAVNSMVEADLREVSFIVANTDAQSLKLSPAHERLQIGMKVTKGLGAGSNPEVGRRAAEEDLESIMQHIGSTDILFLTAGLGGGTGSGSIPVIARAARERGILTVAVVTKPFVFEGKRRARQAEEAIEALRSSVDTLIVIPNQKLLEIADPKISVLDAFALANNVLRQAIKGVADIIMRPGHINVDFADVRSIMKGMGLAIMGTGRASGEDRARIAAEAAINSPLVEEVRIEGARGVLINITGGASLGLHEVSAAAQVIYEKASEEATIILGAVIDPALGEEIMVTVIATGFEAHAALERPAATTQLMHNGRAPQQERVVNVPTPSIEHTVSTGLSASAVHHASSHDASRSGDATDFDTPTFLRERTWQHREGA